ncbi:MAG TPA: RNA polymerase sigma factor [Candidatus Yonathbacteria bacterium]|nr:RNA polymerase sigma factor [Candidatus Yonathbacteria bacterium]
MMISGALNKPAMFLGENTKNNFDIRSKSDEDILALSVKQPAFFEVLLERYQEAFLRKALTVVRVKEDADDVVQETFVKIYRNAEKFEIQEGASFKSWGYKILMNTSFTQYQKMKKKGNMFAELSPEFYETIADTGGDNMETKTLRDDVVSVFSKMPKHLAKVLHLHFIEGRPHKEIAEKEGVTVSAIKTRVHRAKKEFKKITNFNII